MVCYYSKKIGYFERISFYVNFFRIFGLKAQSIYHFHNFEQIVKL